MENQTPLNEGSEDRMSVDPDFATDTAPPPEGARGSLRWFILLVAGIVGVYLLVNLGVNALLNLLKLEEGAYVVFWYILQPVLWAGLGVGGWFFWKRVIQPRPPFSWAVVGVCGLIGLFEVALFYLAGTLAGFGHSPFSARWYMLIVNTIFFGAWFAAMEIARAGFVHYLGRKRSMLALVLGTLLFTVVSTPLGKFQVGPAAPNFIFETIGGFMVPMLAENLLATFVVLIGGPLPAIALRLGIHAYEWLLPVLPDLKWPVLALIGTITPALGLWFLYKVTVEGAEEEEAPKKKAEEESEGTGKKPRAKGSLISWLLIIIFAMALLWFNTGILGVQPTLVSGPSMNPALYAGDVVVTRDVRPEEIAVGDIIRYEQAGIHVIHRVIDIQREGGHYTFITQGDNNNSADDPVDEEYLAGKVVLVIPKIGWVSIMARRLLGWSG
jgi:signal peptidase